MNLRGYDPGAAPIEPGDALAGCCARSGSRATESPPTRTSAPPVPQHAGRSRMLIVLDNAGDEGQVRPLLPGTPGCVALVTSRDALAGLVARDGAARLDLDLLPLADAVACCAR